MPHIFLFSFAVFHGTVITARPSVHRRKGCSAFGMPDIPLLAFSPRNLRFSGGEFHQAGIEIGTKPGTLVVITIIRVDIFTRILTLQSGLAPTDYPTVTFMQFTRQVIRMKPALPSGFIPYTRWRYTSSVQSVIPSRLLPGPWHIPTSRQFFLVS